MPLDYATGDAALRSQTGSAMQVTIRRIIAEKVDLYAFSSLSLRIGRSSESEKIFRATKTPADLDYDSSL